MRFQKIGLTTVVLCTVGIQQSFSIDIVTKEKPNIVFILADDLGWTDLGVMGSDYYETPNIDRLATEGILFDNAYAAAANSAPSRACMMTGMYTPRHGVYTVVSIRPRACFFPLFSFLPLWLHYNLNPLCVQY